MIAQVHVFGVKCPPALGKLPSAVVSIILFPCIDVDECAEQEDVCMHGVCINLEGSFHCDCRRGYTLNTVRDRCVDVDECQLIPNVCGNGSCENIDGSHKCHCFEGFTLSLSNDCTGSYTSFNLSTVSNLMDVKTTQSVIE